MNYADFLIEIGGLRVAMADEQEAKLFAISREMAEYIIKQHDKREAVVDADLLQTAHDMMSCASAWESDARLIGNVRAAGISAMCADYLNRPYLRTQCAAAKPTAQEWQPIETAPRDGTEILLGVDIATVWIVRNGRWDNGEYWDEAGYDSQEEVVGWWAYRNSVGQEMLCGIYEPTHWMPLPTPPEVKEEV